MTGQKVTENGNESAARDEVAEALNLDPRDHVRANRVYVGPLTPHAHESWQIQQDAWNDFYCSACGQTLGGSR